MLSAEAQVGPGGQEGEERGDTKKITLKRKFKRK
jgi:hypothetical protein